MMIDISLNYFRAENVCPLIENFAQHFETNLFILNEYDMVEKILCFLLFSYPSLCFVPSSFTLLAIHLVKID